MTPEELKQKFEEHALRLWRNRWPESCDHFELVNEVATQMQKDLGNWCDSCDQHKERNCSCQRV